MEILFDVLSNYAEIKKKKVKIRLLMEKDSKSDSREESRRRNTRSKSRDKERRDDSRDRKDRARERERERSREPNRDRKRERSDSRPRRSRVLEKEKREDDRDRVKDREKEKDKEKDKEKERDQSRDREKGRSKDRSRDRSRDRIDKTRKDRSEERRKDRSTDRRERKRDRDRENSERGKEDGKDKDKVKNDREREKEKEEREREERDSKRARRSNSRDRDRRRSNQRGRSRSRSASRSISVAKDKTVANKEDNSPRFRRRPAEPPAKPVDENGQFVVGPKRERWRPGQGNLPNDLPHSDSQQQIPPSARPPPPPLPPPKPSSNLPHIMHKSVPEQIPSSRDEEEDYFATLMTRWNQELHQLYNESESSGEKATLTKSWALELENIHILEKYAGKELYQKIVHFREQQSKHLFIQSEEPEEKIAENINITANQSIADLLSRMESAESKEPEEAITSTFVVEAEPNIKEDEMEIEEKIDEEPVEEVGGFDMGDDFDLYGDLGGGLLAAEDEEEEEEKQVQQKAGVKLSNPGNQNEQAIDNMYGDLLDQPVSKTEELPAASEEMLESKQTSLNTVEDFEEERKRSFLYFSQQHPSLPWTGLPYLTQVSIQSFLL